MDMPKKKGKIHGDAKETAELPAYPVFAIVQYASKRTLAVMLKTKNSFDCLQSPSQGCAQGGTITGQKLVLQGVI